MISVLIPNFNNVKYLTESIDSILNQSYKNLQILIYDDGSTDNSQVILKGYEDRDRIRVIYGRKNMGYSFAINMLMRYVKGQFVAFHDADDTSLPNRLEKQRDYLIKNKLMAVGCGMERFWDSGKKSMNLSPPVGWKKILTRIAKRNWGAMYSATILFRRELVDHGHRFDVTITTGPDILWQCRIALEYPKGLGNVPDILYRYRQHPGALTAGRNKKISQKKDAPRKRVFLLYKDALRAIARKLIPEFDS